MTPAAPPTDDARSTRVGLLNGLAAYGWWGLIPFYFKAVAHVAPLEVLAHRTVWSLVLLFGLLALKRRASGLLAPLADRRTRWMLVATTVLIGTNWFVYIWAVTNNQIAQAALGYFINPLVNVLLGMVFLRERLRPLQKVAVGIAALGIAWYAVAHATVPAIALVLAGSFGLYGLLRKKAHVGGAEGLLLEVLLLAPAALAYLAWLGAGDRLAFAHVSRATDLLLVFGGVVTALPLIWFVEAARRLPLYVLGFLQYVAPSLQLALGILVYGEPFTPARGVTFALIWIALAVFSTDMLRSSGLVRRPAH